MEVGIIKKLSITKLVRDKCGLRYEGHILMSKSFDTGNLAVINVVKIADLENMHEFKKIYDNN